MTRLALILVTAAALHAQPVFRFQNNFWVNLHHFLRDDAWRLNNNRPLKLPFDSLDPKERAIWEHAVDGYRDMARASVLSDSVRQVTNALAISEPASGPLIEAAPIYRAHRWDQERRENDDWIAAHQNAIQQHAAAVRRAYAATFHIAAPAQPILVDLARDTGPNLAYTFNGPPGYSGHTVLAPQKNLDPEIAMETIFHEISHTMDRQVNELLYKEAEALHIDPPRDLWHAITIYTTWKLTRRELRPDPARPYTPDADEDQRFRANGWQSLRAALEKDWQPYLDGRGSLTEALRELLHDTRL